MLRFFRIISKKIIDEDNVRKYLLYAIGEILLVVTGILIVLQSSHKDDINAVSHNLEKIESKRFIL